MRTSGSFSIFALLAMLAYCVLCSCAVAQQANIVVPLLQGDAGEKEFQHLDDVMDKYHNRFDVYTDLSSAGNHFVMLGRFPEDATDNDVNIDPGESTAPHSGATCIKNTFFSHTDNWGGWYFMNGVLVGDAIVPSANWGDIPNAGVDLQGATKLTFWAKGAVGGEKVEFFAFGVGRNAATGDPLPGNDYPDGSPKVSLGYVTLNADWQKYTIDVSVAENLSYVLGGFGWTTNAPNNNNQDIVFYLDDISYDLPRLDDSRLLVSYITIPSTDDFDTTLKNVAFTYDNALALIAYLSRGEADDLRRAGLLADALVYASQHDRFYDDGRLRNGYQGGDLVLPPGWVPNGKPGTVRMPGWWDATEVCMNGCAELKAEEPMPAGCWLEDRFNVSTHTGNVAWSIIALVSYYQTQGGDQYLNTAKRLGRWIWRKTFDDRGAGGFRGGCEGWEKPSCDYPDDPIRLRWKSTEHNLDAYVAFARLYQLTNDAVWLDRAHHAKVFAEAMWSSAQGHFWTGTKNNGVRINKSALPADVNTWGIMSLGNLGIYGQGMDWVQANCYVEIDGFKGFDFNDDRDGIWFEGTAHAALTLRILGRNTDANLFLHELERARKTATNANGKGIVAASHDGLSTGFDWQYFSRLHVGATAWAIFAERRYNPYWGIGAGEPIPSY